MPVCSRCASEYQNEVLQPITDNATWASQPPTADQRPGEARLETALTAVVVGLTAQFVVFIFGLAAQFVPSLSGSVLLSSLVGLGIGVIAFALLRGYDQAKLRW